MQESFDFAAAEIARWRGPLIATFGRLVDVPRRRPLGQMLKSLISSRTKDEVSLAAFRRMVRRWQNAKTLSRASVAAVESVIADVTFADRKAVQLLESLRMIGEERPDFGLEFLADVPLPDALPYLERFPGVGRKVAAATLNASTLRRPVFIVDTHVHRVLQRIGFIGPKAKPKDASELVTTSAASMSADDMLELFAQLKLLGQLICRFDKPHCHACPMAACCRTARNAASS